MSGVAVRPSSPKQRGFRALLLGVNEDGKLRYAGKAGTGYTADEMDKLMGLMAPLEVKEPTVAAPRAAVRGAHWIKPKLVAEIAFMEVTGDGVLRHSSYLGLRLDKKPESVVFEKEAPVAEVEAPAPTTVRVTNRERVIFPDAAELLKRSASKDLIGWGRADQVLPDL